VILGDVVVVVVVAAVVVVVVVAVVAKAMIKYSRCYRIAYI